MSDNVSDNISISEIRERIAKRGQCAGPMTTFPGDGIAHVTTVCGDNWVEYIQWLDAMVNRTPVLVDIVAAALALREQEKIAAKARYLVYASLNEKAVPTVENYSASGLEDSKLARCRAAYVAALAMVRE